MQAARILPDLQCSLLCQDVRLEANGNFFLIGVLDAVRVPQLPITAFVLHVFNRWTAGLGQFIEQVRLLAPDQATVLHKVETRFTLPNPTVNATTVTVLRNVQFTQPGPYWVEVLVEEVMKVRYPVHVVVVPPPQPQSAQPRADQPTEQAPGPGSASSPEPSKAQPPPSSDPGRAASDSSPEV
jgi:hypothetical protein